MVTGSRHGERTVDGDDAQPQRPPWAVRFSLTMHALNPGVLILFRWLRWIVVLVTLWRVPEALAWLR
jgi:hypothetical protein